MTNLNSNHLFTAVIGETAVSMADQVVMPTPDDIQSFGQLFIQLIIGIVTIWKMVKKPKPKAPTEPTQPEN